MIFSSSSRFFISSRLRARKLVIILFVLELAFTVPVLALFGIADPDLYRTRLWQDGSDNGFNSNPNTVMFSYANHQDPPLATPLVWSQFVTSFNVVISVLSTFLLLVKAVMFVLHCWYPILSFLVHGLCVGLWGFSIYAQSSSDTTEPGKLQTGAPWYITKSCNVAFDKNNVHYCQQAKASFIVTVIVFALFTINCAVGLWSMFPTKEQRIARKTKIEEEKEYEETYPADDDSEHSWEMKTFPKSPMLAKTPMTPRTTAFNKLGGGPPPARTMPFRH